LVGIKHFLGEHALTEEKQDAADLRKARAELPPDFDYLKADTFDDPLTLQQTKIAARMQAQFEKRIIRRTIDSLDWRGSPLIPLPKCHTITVDLKLDPREMDIIEVLAERVKKK